MQSVTTAGVAVLCLGLAGYGLGLFVAYPGRALSVTAVMAGLTLAVVGRSTEGEGP